MSSKTEICNVSLIRLGVTKLIANVDTENSNNARAFRSIFDGERDFVLADFFWPFAKTYAALGLVDGSETEPTNYDWRFAYRVPSDCATPRRLSTGRDGRKAATPPAWEVGQDNDGLLIFTDEENAVLEYTALITNVGRFDPIFRSALSWKLAKSLAAPLSRIKSIVETCNNQYEIEIDKARGRALNAKQLDAPGPSELEWSRD